MIDLYAHTNASAARNGSRSLPRVVLPANQSSAPNLKNLNLGMTVEGKERKGLPPYVDVVGQPSLQLQRASEGVVSLLRRNSKFTEYITDEDIDKFIRPIVKKILSLAKSLSKGSLSDLDLYHLNHPYGLGTTTPSGRKRKSVGRLTQRKGVSNMAVVNKHSGHFLDSWDIDILRDKAGISIPLSNTAEYASYLAFGTKKNKKGRGGMRAHGPFTTAVTKFLFEINRAWAMLARRGYQRQLALMGGG